jgi:mannosyltransferase
MALFQDLTRRQPNAKDDSPEKTDDAPRRAAKYAPRKSFWNRRVRLTSDSSLSVPLGLVLLFPCLVIIVILTLFARSPDSNDLMNMPTGTPLSVRYVFCHSLAPYEQQLTLV